MPYDEATPHLAIPLIYSGQAQKEVTANTAFLAFDRLLNTGAIDITDTPPGSPTDGDLYLVAASATGDWLGHDDELACYHDGLGWVFVTPNEGMTVWVNDEDKHYTWDSSSWIVSDNLQNVSWVGINATADATNRLSVSSAAVLFDHDGDDSQVKVNKDSTSDTASHLFQTNYSGRAEFGLTGDDDFHAKVSPDGSSWSEALVIDKDNGQLHVQQGISFNDGTHLLSAYEKGTFTPTLFGSSTTGSATYSDNEGLYVRTGDAVHFSLRLALSSKGGLVGQVRMGGFPFTVGGDVSNRAGAAIGRIAGLNLATNAPILPLLIHNQAYLWFYKQEITGGASSLSNSEISDSFEIYLSGTYLL